MTRYAGIVVRPGLHALDGTFLASPEPVHRVLLYPEVLEAGSLTDRVAPPISYPHVELVHTGLLPNGFGVWHERSMSEVDFTALLVRAYANNSPVGLRHERRLDHEVRL